MLQWEYMNKEKLAYVAGVFDGEGCITIRLNRPTATSKHKTPLYAIVTKVTMTHEPTVKYLYDLFRIGHFRLTKVATETEKTAWSWTCMSKDAGIFLELVYPFLLTKKKEAKIALQFLKM